MKTLSIDLPEALAAALEKAVVDNGFIDSQELAREAIRRYIDSHSAELHERFIREDIAWGLKGK